MSDRLFDDNYKFSASGTYYAPTEGILSSYVEYINALPRNDSTEVFGLHSNAEISYAIIETNKMCETVLSLLPRAGKIFIFIKNTF